MKDCCMIVCDEWDRKLDVKGRHPEWQSFAHNELTNVRS